MPHNAENSVLQDTRNSVAQITENWQFNFADEPRCPGSPKRIAVGLRPSSVGKFLELFGEGLGFESRERVFWELRDRAMVIWERKQIRRSIGTGAGAFGSPQAQSIRVAIWPSWQGVGLSWARSRDGVP